MAAGLGQDGCQTVLPQRALAAGAAGWSAWAVSPGATRPELSALRSRVRKGTESAKPLEPRVNYRAQWPRSCFVPGYELLHEAWRGPGVGRHVCVFARGIPVALGGFGASRKVVTAPELGAPKWYPEVKPAWLGRGETPLGRRLALRNGSSPLWAKVSPGWGQLGPRRGPGGQGVLRLEQPHVWREGPSQPGPRVSAHPWALGCRMKAQPPSRPWGSSCHRPLAALSF